MNISRVWVYLSTLGPIGYMSAPGTVATLLTMPLVFWLRTMIPDQRMFGIFLVLFFFLCVLIIHKALQRLKRLDDPSEIVLDEVIGCLFTFWGISLYLQTAIIGFVLFRFFDIAKILGIKYVERFPGAWGVILDDLMAAAVANLILRMIF